MRIRPPRYALIFLRWFCRAEHLEEIEGNLIEIFEEQYEKAPQLAKLTFAWQVLRHFRPDFVRPLQLLNLSIHPDMFRNYFKLAGRNLSKHKLFSLIHISGLAIGTAACLLIFQYVSFERSYDRFHERADDIYRVPIQYSEGFGSFPKTASNHPGLGPAMLADFPEVEAFTRLLHPSNVGGRVFLSAQSETGHSDTYSEERIYAADSGFFRIFSYSFVAGDPASALTLPGSIVLSASLAKKYFGEGDHVGKTLHSTGIDFTVTGIVKDVPANSHLDFDGLISFNTYFNDIPDGKRWIWPEFYTYVLLRPGTDPAKLESKFPAFTERYMALVHKEYDFMTYFSLQPLLDIHLKTDCANEPTTPGSERMVYFLTLLGIFILVIAWVNYINLSTSSSLQRAKEVGVRKVVGAMRRQLIGQFLTESFLLNALGIFMGICLAKLLLPEFTSLVGKDIGDSLMSIGLLIQPQFWMVLIGSVVAGSLVAGLYPAIVLSSFRPTWALRGGHLKSVQGLLVRRLLVGFQLVLSIMLIAVTILVTRQLAFMSQKELGYTKDQILVLKAPIARNPEELTRVQTLATELGKLAMVNSVGKSSEIPGKLIAFRSETRKDGQGKDYNQPTYLQSVDDQFIPTFGIQLAAGRNFFAQSSNRTTEADRDKVLINEVLSASYGFKTPIDAIGQHIRYKFGSVDHRAEIVGVVKNYHQRSLKEAYDPILYNLNFGNWTYYSLNVTTDDWRASVAMIEEKYKSFFPNNAVEYFFLDEFFDRQYGEDQRFAKVCKVMAGLAIFVACLGFLGLSALILIQRAKEIGVRKILGASTLGILILITRSFIGILLLANLLALPLVIYFGRRWLDNFAFNVGLGWQIFVLPMLLLLSVVLVIVAVQMRQTAVLDPVESLRSE